MGVQVVRHGFDVAGLGADSLVSQQHRDPVVDEPLARCDDFNGRYCGPPQLAFG